MTNLQPEEISMQTFEKTAMLKLTLGYHFNSVTERAIETMQLNKIKDAPTVKSCFLDDDIW